MTAHTIPSAALGEPLEVHTHAVGDTPRHAVYLWHGRGGSAAQWARVVPDLRELVERGMLPPLLLVAPEAQWSRGGHWYVDSRFTGTPAGRPVETALVVELVAEVERRFGVTATREHRVVAGCSIGGAGALRHLLAHRDVFAAGVAMAPPAWHPQPPWRSSARDFGAFGVGSLRFDARRWSELSPRAEQPARSPSVRLAIACGTDDELLAVSRATYAELSAVPEIDASIAELPGGHDFDAWTPALVDGLRRVLPVGARPGSDS